MDWINVSTIPPVADDDIDYLVWEKTPSGRGRAGVYGLLDDNGHRWWYNGNEDENLEYEDVTHYIIIQGPQ